MKKEIYDELVATIEKHKDATCYALAILNPENGCLTMTNGDPMQLAFMVKSLDGLYSQLIAKPKKDEPTA